MAGRPRGGALVAAAWLMGLGTIFLVRDYAGLSWGQAWPMFVMLVGLGMLASSVAWGPRHWSGSWWRVWPVAWIGVGFVLLMSTTGRLAVSPGDLVSHWWPLIPIGIGAWFLVAAVWPGRAVPSETVSLPLAGAQHAAVALRFGAGQLAVTRDRGGALLSGTGTGGIRVTRDRSGSVDLQPDVAGGWVGWDRPLDWRLGLTGEVPLDLRVEMGAARAVLDLTDLQLRRLDLRMGASETRLRLPAAAGRTAVTAETGAASLAIEVPQGVAARIRMRMALGSVVVDEARFPRTADGYASPDWEAATNRVEIDIQGGVGSVRIG